MFKRSLTLPQIGRSILLMGATNTIIVQSEPGCGKSSLLKWMAEQNNDQWRKPGDYFPSDKYHYIYVDCNDVQYGDLVSKVPVISERQILEMVAALFRMDDPRPKVIMFDEVLKIPKMMKGVVTRAMYNRTLGDQPFPEGTIVFGTSNNARDNIGDTTQGHEGNRVSFAQMRKPDGDVWLPWAYANNIHDTICAMVKLNPVLLESCMLLDKASLDANPYIWNPEKPAFSFVSPRSLESASNYLHKRQQLGEENVLALLDGTWGVAATNLLETFWQMEKHLVKPETIIADPLNAPIPGSDIVLLLTLFKSASAIKTQDHLSAYVQYVQRLTSKESQSVWAAKIIKDPRTESLARRNEYLRQWRIDNLDYMP